MKTPFVVWQDRYSIGIEEIDEQHRGLFALTNDLYDACQDGGTVLGKHFQETLQKAVTYVTMHFNAEERIMTETRDPNFESHQQEHDDFVKKVMEEASKLETGVATPQAFMEFLRDWISIHVTGTDVKIGQHVASLKGKMS
ncbi:MAG: bacteriohemerythrin [Treponema sp.]|nr:bacteriohemerythrin [Treponema sp.]